jgi:hypothetical protein
MSERYRRVVDAVRAAASRRQLAEHGG